MSPARVALLAAVGAVLAACGGAPAESAASRPSIASVHRAKCGACHAPPDPGTRSRAALESAFERHRAGRRVRLNDSEWAAMVDYLAATEGQAHVDANAGGAAR